MIAGPCVYIPCESPLLQADCKNKEEGFNQKRRRGANNVKNVSEGNKWNEEDAAVSLFVVDC